MGMHRFIGFFSEEGLEGAIDLGEDGSVDYFAGVFADNYYIKQINASEYVSFLNKIRDEKGEPQVDPEIYGVLKITT
jgi:hypothetical protein